jgi:hypothetical protein
MGAPSVSVALTGSDQQVRPAGGSIYTGIVVRETAASTAVVRVYDGTSASGILIDQVTLAANGEVVRGCDGVRCADGIFVDVVSGAVAGSVRFR